jgi:LPXTG-motif cell wall-anchored protein
MDSHRALRRQLFSLLGAGIVCVVFAVAMLAQETSKTEAKAGAASKQVQVERGEVVYVSGNDVVIKMENGEVRHFTPPPGATGTVDGKQVTIHDLKPGMKLQRSITTTTTPRVVTTVRSVQGKVFHVNPPTSVILTLADGTNKQYKVPRDQKFMIDGQEKTVFELRKGMNVTATAITQVPETVVAQERKVTGSAPPPPEMPAMQGALLIEDLPAPAAKPAPAPAAAAPAPAPEPAPTKLPKTGSELPLIGLLGLLCSGLSIGIRMLRKS